jgi:hypothetical protein
MALFTAGRKMSDEPYEDLGTELKVRLRAHLPSSYVLMISIVKGIALGNGGLAVAHYVAQTPNLDVDLTAAGMIGVSLAAVVVTYNGTLVGNLLTSWAPSWVDTTLPVLIGLLEFLMFSIAQLGTGRLVLEKWVAALMLWALLVAILLWQIRGRVPAETGDDPTSKLYRWYRGTLGIDIRMVLAFLAIAAGFFIALAWFAPAFFVERIIGLPLTLLFLIVSSAFHESRRGTAYEMINALEGGGTGRRVTADDAEAR